MISKKTMTYLSESISIKQDWEPEILKGKTGYFVKDLDKHVRLSNWVINPIRCYSIKGLEKYETYLFCDIVIFTKRAQVTLAGACLNSKAMKRIHRYHPLMKWFFVKYSDGKELKTIFWSGVLRDCIMWCQNEGLMETFDNDFQIRNLLPKKPDTTVKRYKKAQPKVANHLFDDSDDFMNY